MLEFQIALTEWYIYAFAGDAIPSIQHGSIVDGGLDEIA